MFEYEGFPIGSFRSIQVTHFRLTFRFFQNPTFWSIILHSVGLALPLTPPIFLSLNKKGLKSLLDSLSRDFLNAFFVSSISLLQPAGKHFFNFLTKCLLLQEMREFSSIVLLFFHPHLSKQTHKLRKTPGSSWATLEKKDKEKKVEPIALWGHTWR